MGFFSRAAAYLDVDLVLLVRVHSERHASVRDSENDLD